MENKTVNIDWLISKIDYELSQSTLSRYITTTGKQISTDVGYVEDYEEWTRAKRKGLYMSNYISEREIGLSLNPNEYTMPQSTRQYVTAHGYWVKD